MPKKSDVKASIFIPYGMNRILKREAGKLRISKSKLVINILTSVLEQASKQEHKRR